MADTATVHLDDANVDVTLQVKFGDLRAIDAAGNEHTAFVPGPKGGLVQKELPGAFITARDNALLARVPRTWVPAGGNVAPTAVTPQWVDDLSLRDGKKLEGACWDLVTDVRSSYAEKSPKGKS